MKIQLSCIALLMSAFVSMHAVAKGETPAVLKAETAETAEAFQPQIDRVREGMNTGGRYEFTKEEDKIAVNQSLDRMMDLLKKSGSVAAMKEEDKIALINMQEKINATLTHSDSQRLVCEREAQPGSLLRVTTCHTYAELVARSKLSQEELEKSQNHVMIQPFRAGAGH